MPAPLHLHTDAQVLLPVPRSRRRAQSTGGCTGEYVFFFLKSCSLRSRLAQRTRRLLLRHVSLSSTSRVASTVTGPGQVLRSFDVHVVSEHFAVSVCARKTSRTCSTTPTHRHGIRVELALLWNSALQHFGTASFRSSLDHWEYMVYLRARLLQETVSCQKPQFHTLTSSKVGFEFSFKPSYHFFGSNQASRHHVQSFTPSTLAHLSPFHSGRQTLVTRTVPFHSASTEELDLGQFETPSIPKSTPPFGSIRHTRSRVLVHREEYSSHRNRTGCVPKSLQLDRDPTFLL